MTIVQKLAIKTTIMALITSLRIPFPLLFFSAFFQQVPECTPLHNVGSGITYPGSKTLFSLPQENFSFITVGDDALPSL
jgi:hypothetical protein